VFAPSWHEPVELPCSVITLSWEMWWRSVVASGAKLFRGARPGKKISS